ncbi:MAG: helix-turn-helix transcriptional regulator [Deltaproteobacteria bacterium]|nr:helix-turn-helix transcriptional regulator [Deltaproteobacteria bacterium]
MDDMLTTRELAQLLRLNEKKVYQLVRDGTVPRVRIAGKWLFPRNHVMRWIDENVQRQKDILIVGSDDVLLSRLLSAYSRENIPESIAYYSPVGSAKGVEALSRGKCQACSTHILDMETGEYNLPYLGRVLSGQKYIVVNLWHRRQGLIVKKGNPLGLKAMRDCSEKGVRFAGRNTGSGTQVLTEYLLRKEGPDENAALRIVGACDTHMEVALKVFFNEADAGIAIEYVTHPLGLDFIPLKDERLDLVVPKELWATFYIKRFIDYLDPAIVTKISQNLPGYDLKDTGKVIFSS